MSETEEKTEEPTDRKLRKQREEGSVPQSQAMVGFATCALGLGVLTAVAPMVFAQLSAAFAQVFDAIATPSPFQR